MSMHAAAAAAAAAAATIVASFNFKRPGRQVTFQ